MSKQAIMKIVGDKVNPEIRREVSQALDKFYAKDASPEVSQAMRDFKADSAYRDGNAIVIIGAKAKDMVMMYRSMGYTVKESGDKIRISS
jgi:hypothetical protein